MTPVLALVAALALAGGGIGFGAGEKEGSAGLTVTTGYGSELLIERPLDGLSQSSTAMRLLDGSTEIETRYGGGFVQSIQGISGTAGSRSSDWFYFVNGVAAERGAAEFLVGPGDRIWWDFRDWTDAMDLNAVVGAFPAPMSTGFDGSDWPVAVECPVEDAACEMVEAQLARHGVEVSAGERPAALRIVVGDWRSIRSDAAARRLGSAPAVSGVFARFFQDDGRITLQGLGVDGTTVREFGPGSGLVAATRRAGEPPVWLVTGTDRAGVRLAAAALNPEDLANRYAAFVQNGRVGSLPIVRPGPESPDSGDPR